MSRIAMIGMGRLGLPVALSMESKGHEVVGVDVQPGIQQYLDNKVIPYQEEGVQELLKDTKIKLTNLYNAIGFAEIVFIAIQTPAQSGYDGETPLPKDKADYDYSYLVKGVRDIARACGDLKKHITLVVMSTVLPGTTEKYLKPLFNEYIHYAYEPFFVAMGQVRQDFEHPEFVLLGSDESEEAVFNLRRFWGTITKAPILEVPVKDAELIKVLYNVFLSSKISFITSAQELCHKVGANIDSISKAMSLGTNRLLSPKYLNGGGADSGPCHPKDITALCWISEQNDLSYNWFESIMTQREKYVYWLADLIEEQARKKDTNQVVLCGVAFKKNINLTIGSYVLLLKEFLQDRGFKVYEWDPHVHLDQQRMQIGSLNKHLYFIGTDHNEFKDLKFLPGSIVLDVWGIIPDQENIEVIRIGRK